MGRGKCAGGGGGGGGKCNIVGGQKYSMPSRVVKGQPHHGFLRVAKYLLGGH